MLQENNMIPSIMTVSGNYFDYLNPQSDQYSIEDIAHALSHICRFGGNTPNFYSVAQHSVLVSRVVSPEYALHGLIHDAAEAFLGDIPTPLKRLLPDYQLIEERCEKVIFESFGISAKLPEEVKYADRVLLATERRDLLIPHHDTERWNVMEHIQPMRERIYAESPSEAKRKFIMRYMELKDDLWVESCLNRESQNG